MDEREKIIRLWFDMWLNQQDLGIDDIFTDDLIYIESWGPKYENRELLKHTGSMNGILVEKFLYGILNNFSIRTTKPLWNGISKIK